jgi:hypothetical protein
MSPSLPSQKRKRTMSVEKLVFSRRENEGTWREHAEGTYEALVASVITSTASMGSVGIEVTEVAVLRRSTIKPKRVEVQAEVTEEVKDVDVTPKVDTEEPK